MAVVYGCRFVAVIFPGIVGGHGPPLQEDESREGENHFWSKLPAITGSRAWRVVQP